MARNLPEERGYDLATTTTEDGRPLAAAATPVTVGTASPFATAATIPTATIPTGCADFLSRVAHDLRSPLGVIAEVLPTMQHDLADHLSDEHKAMLKLAGRSVYRLRMFVERMRLVADLELGRLSPVRNPVVLGPVVQQAVDTMLANEPRRGVTVSCAVGPEQQSVNVDVHQLGHAVTELLSNAMRHASSQVRVSCEKTGSEVRVIVEDDGTGLSDAERDALFRRFVQRPSRNGLGIGLSLARDLMLAQDGRLSYEKGHLASARGKGVGARFVISMESN